MTTTIYNKLQALYDAPFKVSGAKNGSKEYVAMRDLLDRGIAYTGVSSRRGKDIWTDRVYNYLTAHGFKCEKGNNAPRGGANGEYVKIVSPAFQKEVKARIKAEQEKRAKEQAEAQAKAEAHKAHIVELAKAVNIEDYKEEIKNILIEIDYFNHACGTSDTLNRWGKGQVIHRLNMKHHLSCEVLGKVLEGYKIEG